MRGFGGTRTRVWPVWSDARAGKSVDVHVTDRVIQVWDGNQLLKTAARTTTGEVRKKRASVARTED